MRRSGTIRIEVSPGELIDRLSPSPKLKGLIDRLGRVNEFLWGAEDEARGCEAAHDFGGHFASHARSIYRLNDERAALKRQINVLLGSRLMEEKAHGGARPIIRADLSCYYRRP